MTDFTPKQATRWLAQEAAKHTTPESIRDRIASEENWAKIVKEHDLPDFPNSRKAHETLVTVLRQRL